MTGTLGAGEFHRFPGAGKPFVYLVPSAAVFALDEASEAVLDTLSAKQRTRDGLGSELGSRFDPMLLDETISELARVRAIGDVTPLPVVAKPPKVFPLMPFPLTTMVLNVTNQCNLSCAY